MEDVKVEQFSDNQGSAANEHAKKIAKKEAKRKLLEEAPHKIVYTKSGNKVLEVKVSARGAESKYYGNVTKPKEKQHIEEQMVIWKKNGQWVNGDDFEDKCSDIVKSFQKK
jgi:hypothetical protein